MMFSIDVLNFLMNCICNWLFLLLIGLLLDGRLYAGLKARSVQHVWWVPITAAIVQLAVSVGAPQVCSRNSTHLRGEVQQSERLKGSAALLLNPTFWATSFQRGLWSLAAKRASG